MSRNLSFYETITENQSTAILVTNQDFNVIYTNESAERMLGLSLNKTKDKALAECFLSSLELQYIANEAIHQHRSFTEYSLTLTNLHLKTFHIDCAVTPVDEQYILFEMQETHQRNIIKQQEQLNNMQDASSLMMQGLAHEIRNPLAGLKGTAQLLQKQNNEKIAPYLDIFINEIDRLNTLLNDTLADNTAPSKKENVNIHQILNHVCKLMEAELGDSIRFNLDYDPSIPDIIADGQQLTQALLNIIKNAAEAMQEKGEIKLITRIYSASPSVGLRIKNKLHISVQDTGPGISEEIQNKVFIPMVTTKAKGTGIGLYITHTIIRRHGGQISFESSPGKTIFNIYLPLTND